MYFFRLVGEGSAERNTGLIYNRILLQYIASSLDLLQVFNN